MIGPAFLITGASAGIGADLAIALAPTATLQLTYRKGLEGAAAVRRACLSAGASSVELRELDLGSPDSVRALADDVGRTGRSDWFVIHNAGAIEKGSLGEQMDEAIIAQANANLVGPMLLTKHLLGIARGFAFIGSDVGVTAIPGMPAYCATKAGVRAFAKALSLEPGRPPTLLINPDRTATRMNDGEGRDVSAVASVIAQMLNEWISDGMSPQFREVHVRDRFQGPP